MLNCTIPGGRTLQLAHLVLDYNGTIALDGRLLDGVAERLGRLAEFLEIHVLTADTHGTVKEKVRGFPCRLAVIGPDAQDQAKLAYIERLDSRLVAAIGNGRNDWLMLERAALGIAVVGGEGASSRALMAADLVCTGITDGLDVLLLPRRLQATLRN